MWILNIVTLDIFTNTIESPAQLFSDKKTAETCGKEQLIEICKNEKVSPEIDFDKMTFEDLRKFCAGNRIAYSSVQFNPATRKEHT